MSDAVPRHWDRLADDALPVAFNIFMKVFVNGKSGNVMILPPLSPTVCPAPNSNSGTFKRTHVEIAQKPAA